MPAARAPDHERAAEIAGEIIATEWRFVGLRLHAPSGPGILMPPLAEAALLELARAYLDLARAYLELTDGAYQPSPAPQS